MTDVIRLIATDLDGTLLRSDRTVSERTRNTIGRVQAAGITIVIATARHPATARNFAEMAGITGLAICSNGAIIYDLGRDAIVSETHLPAGTASLLIDRLRTQAPGVLFAALGGTDFACEPGYAAIADLHDHGRSGPPLSLFEGASLTQMPISKLIARHPTLSPAELLDHVTALAMTGIESSWSGAPFLDVMAAGVSKAAALATICAELGIAPSEVAAFGDAANDLPMLRWAGRPVVVANAFPEVLAEIGETTARNDDDGVALAIERILAERRSAVRAQTLR